MKGDDGLVVVTGFAKGDGGCGVEVGNYEVLELPR